MGPVCPVNITGVVVFLNSTGVKLNQNKTHNIKDFPYGTPCINSLSIVYLDVYLASL